MEPAFYRGDLILLSAAAEYAVGDIVVYNVPGQPIPIVHRVLETRAAGARTLLLTKGDNNAVDDLELYGGREWLEHEHIVGAVRGSVLLCVRMLSRERLTRAQVHPVRRIRHHRDGMLSPFAPVHGWSRAQNDFPQLKYALFGGLGLLALVRGEQ
jgi:signal peptidase